MKSFRSFAACRQNIMGPLALGALALAISAAPLFAHPALAGSSAQDYAARYGVGSSGDVGAMMSDPRAQAALQKYAPQVASDPKQMQAVRSMSPSQLESLARSFLPADLITRAEAKLAGHGR